MLFLEKKGLFFEKVTLLWPESCVAGPICLAKRILCDMWSDRNAAVYDSLREKRGFCEKKCGKSVSD